MMRKTKEKRKGGDVEEGAEIVTPLLPL